MPIPPAVLLLAVGALTALHLVAASSTGGGFPAKLRLERALPMKGIGLEHLIARDRVRHGRRSLLGASPSPAGVVDFPVEGSANPFTVGLYYTSVKLGNPPKEFHVQIDTGSDILWVNCSPCDGCPASSGLSIPLEFFEPDKSSTSSLMTCSDNRCTHALQTGQAICNSSANAICGYSFQYGDGSGTAGYYVYDNLYFDSVLGDTESMNSSATIVFGCSNYQSGDLTKTDRAVDGIIGFGQDELSVISQLSSVGVTPYVFSHCLKGSDNGGGILVLGEIIESGLVYTPLVPSQPHYNINLESIAVNGQTLDIDPSVFATMNTQGTIIDSGTTLTYLADKAYDAFFDAIIYSLPLSVQPIPGKGNECFITLSSIDDSFPSVTLNFEGGASMLLKPENYLFQQGVFENSLVWCIGWQNSLGAGLTILGDMVLKDKIIVYDLANQRIGWKNYDCSQSVNVSTDYSQNQYINTGQLEVNGSYRIAFSKLLWTSIGFALVHILNLCSLGR